MAMQGIANPRMGVRFPLSAPMHEELCMFKRIIVIATLIPAIAFAQSGSHNHGHSELHEYYKKLYIPDIPEAIPGSCCNLRVVHPNGSITGDCRPVRAWPDDDGVWNAYVDGKKIRIPPEKMILKDQPMPLDGNAHLCMSEVGVVYCFIKPQVKI